MPFHFDPGAANSDSKDTNAYTADFAGLGENPNITDIINLIPQDSTDEMYLERGRVEDGWSFSWRDSAGVLWKCWGHPSDPGAPAGGHGAAGPTFRVSKEVGPTSYLMTHQYATFGHTIGVRWSNGNSQNQIRHSHVPMNDARHYFV